MTSYKNLAGNVGICSYELGENEMRIKFHSHKNIIFDQQETDENHYNEMRVLATQGFGLHRYISTNFKYMLD